MKLFEECLEHVNESLTVLLVALQVLSNEQNQLGKEGERGRGEQREGKTVSDKIAIPNKL